MATFNGIGEVTADTRKFGPRDFVFQPGGTAEGNVYTDFAALYADLAVATGRKRLVFDATFGAVTVPAGTYDFAETVWTSEFLVPVTIAAGVEITNLGVIENLSLSYNDPAPAAPALGYYSGAATTLILRNTFITTTPGSAPLILIVFATPVTILADACRFGGAASWVFGLGDTSSLALLLQNSCRLEPSTVTGAGGTFLAVFYDVTSRADTGQAAGTNNFTPQSQAQDLYLNAGGMAHVASWDVQGAIADLDAAIGGGGGEDLAATLVLGNITGGTDIEVTSGDVIKGEDAAPASGNPGFPVTLQGGAGDGAGKQGPVVLSVGADGSIQADTGGNARGTGAVDLQASRTVATQVASGERSIILGGAQNTASGIRSIAGGFHCQAAGPEAIAMGLWSNALSDFCIALGSNSDAYGDYDLAMQGGYAHGFNCTAIGYRAEAEGYYGIAIGVSTHAYGYAMALQNGRATAFRSFAAGRGIANGVGSVSLSSSQAEGPYSTTFGINSYSTVHGQVCNAGGKSLSGIGNGGQQWSIYTLFAWTGDATPTVLTADSLETQRLTIRANMTYAMRIIVSARNTGVGLGTLGDSAMWEGTCMLKRDLANNTTLVSAGNLSKVEADAGAAAWTAVVSADDVNEALSITVTGELGVGIVWHATILDSECGDP